MRNTKFGLYTEGIDTWRKVLASVPVDARLVTYERAVSDVAGFVARGLDRVAAADALHEIALTYGVIELLSEDEVQAIISDRFEHIVLQEVVPDLQAPAVGDNGKGRTKRPGPRLLSKADFIGGFIPPDYLIDGMLQRRFVYSLTGQTGHAKSAIALLVSELVSSTDPDLRYFGVHEVFKGRVCYFVGENPDDIRMRVIGADSKRNGGPDPLIDHIVFIPGVFNISEMFAELERQMKVVGSFELIVVDTSAAYFLGNEELSNTQMGTHARMLRRLTELPGGPCVLVLCHPIKHAIEPSQLLPRGGGAFLAEVDGNLTAWKHDNSLIELHHSDKFRGPGFEPISLRVERITAAGLVDARGRMIPTVRAVVISQTEEDRETTKTREDDDILLAKMLEHSASSIADLAKACGWMSANGEPHKSKVHRALDRMMTKERPALVKKQRGQWQLTEEGKKVAREAALRLVRLAEQQERQMGMNL